MAEATPSGICFTCTAPANGSVVFCKKPSRGQVLAFLTRQALAWW